MWGVRCQPVRVLAEEARGWIGSRHLGHLLSLLRPPSSDQNVSPGNHCTHHIPSKPLPISGKHLAMSPLSLCNKHCSIWHQEPNHNTTAAAATASHPFRPTSYFSTTIVPRASFARTWRARTHAAWHPGPCPSSAGHPGQRQLETGEEVRAEPGSQPTKFLADRCTEIWHRKMQCNAGPEFLTSIHSIQSVSRLVT